MKYHSLEQKRVKLYNYISTHLLQNHPVYTRWTFNWIYRNGTTTRINIWEIIWPNICSTKCRKNDIKFLIKCALIVDLVKTASITTWCHWNYCDSSNSHPSHPHRLNNWVTMNFIDCNTKSSSMTYFKPYHSAALRVQSSH